MDTLQENLIKCTRGFPIAIAAMGKIIVESYETTQQKPSMLGRVAKWGALGAGLLGAGALYSPETVGNIGHSVGNFANEHGMNGVGNAINSATDTTQNSLQGARNWMTNQWNSVMKAPQPVQPTESPDPSQTEKTQFMDNKNKIEQAKVGVQQHQQDIDNMTGRLNTTGGTTTVGGVGGPGVKTPSPFGPSSGQSAPAPATPQSTTQVGQTNVGGTHPSNNPPQTTYST